MRATTVFRRLLSFCLMVACKQVEQLNSSQQSASMKTVSQEKRQSACKRKLVLAHSPMRNLSEAPTVCSCTNLAVLPFRRINEQWWTFAPNARTYRFAETLFIIYHARLILDSSRYSSNVFPPPISCRSQFRSIWAAQMHRTTGHRLLRAFMHAVCGSLLLNHISKTNLCCARHIPVRLVNEI